MRQKHLGLQCLCDSRVVAGIQQSSSLPSRLDADPELYELVAAAEPGYGLLDIVKSLALEMNAKEVETAMQLMYQLCSASLARDRFEV